MIAELKDTLQRIWSALLQKSIVKGVKDFSKQLEAVCQLTEGILNINCDHWHNSYWWTLLLYDFINVMRLFQKKIVNTTESCKKLLKFRSTVKKIYCSSHKH